MVESLMYELKFASGVKHFVSRAIESSFLIVSTLIV